MKIYFTSTPRGIKEFGSQYQKIYNIIKDLGFNHVHEFLFQDDKYLLSTSDASFAKNYLETISDLKKSDIAVFEISTNSLGVGFLINKALELGKPTIVLYLVGHQPILLEGVNDDKLQVVEYNEDNLKFILKDALKLAKEGMDTRFNFFISPKHEEFLNWVSNTKKIPRAVYLRNLIEREMDKEKKFKK